MLQTNSGKGRCWTEMWPGCLHCRLLNDDIQGCEITVISADQVFLAECLDAGLSIHSSKIQINAETLTLYTKTAPVQ